METYLIQKDNDSIVLEKTSGVGLKVDSAAPTFPWGDIIGDVRPKTTGANTPVLAAFRGGQVQAYKFVANDVIDFTFHIPHDYAPATDLFWHIHWAHNGTAISGNAVFTSYFTYAKRHNQQDFVAEVSDTITYNTVDITTTPQYRHRIDEVQLSASSPSASQLDSDDIEPDGILVVRTILTTLPTITAGNLFIFTGDIHYQSVNVGTKQKSPNFYV